MTTLAVPWQTRDFQHLPVILPCPTRTIKCPSSVERHFACRESCSLDLRVEGVLIRQSYKGVAQALVMP